MRWLWFGLGWISVAIGGIGVVVPGLPTTVFMIMAAWCFSKSSPRFEQWVLDLPGVGPQVAAYRRGEGMPMRAKIMAITMLTIACLVSALILVDTWWVSVIILAAGAIGWYWIGWRVPTRRSETPADERAA